MGLKDEVTGEVDKEAIILIAIAEVRKELQALKLNGSSKEAQLECFQRLINLFSSLNVEKLIKERE